LILLAARGLTALPGGMSLRVGVLIVVAGLSVWGIPWVRGQVEAKPDVRGATDYVLVTSRTGDVVFVQGTGYTTLSLRHYLHDVDPAALRVVVEPESPPAAEAAPAGVSLWAIGLRGPSEATSEASDQMVASLGWRLLETRWFDGVLVRRFGRGGNAATKP
jgi:hypothetical protein